MFRAEKGLLKKTVVPGLEKSLYLCLYYMRLTAIKNGGLQKSR